MPHSLKKRILWLLYGATIVFIWGTNAFAQGLSTSPIPDSSSEIADLYFAPANKKSLAVIYNDTAVGRVDIFKHLGVTLLPVGKLTQVLGITLKIDSENGTAEGRLPNGKKVMIIPAKNTVLVDGTEKKQVPGLMFIRDGEIYVDNSVFVDVFSLTVYMSYSLNTLRISRAAEEAVAPASPAPAVVPTPIPAPVSQTKPTTAPPVPAPESTKSAPPSLPASSSHAAPPGKNEEETLVMQLLIDDYTMEEFVEGYRKGDKLYLPLGQLTALVDFAITTDPAKKIAKGWFIREENTFVLNSDSVTVKGETMPLPAGSMLEKNQDLFIDADLIQRWFPIDFLFDSYNMTLLLNTREPLPFEERMQREKRRKMLGQQPAPKEVTYKTVDYPYQAAEFPFVNMTFSPSYQSQDSQSRADYSIIATGDLAYMTAHLYAGGDLNQKVFTDLRLTLGQNDYERNLLGPMKASSFSLGDINSVGLSQVAQASPGRGATLTNRSSDRSDKFDVTSFIGDSTPGWEVELYRNSTLISSQTIGADGRYTFTDIPILFGNNTFRLVFFGPQGQVDEIVKNINASSALLAEGDFTYNFSADQENKTLFNVADSSSQNTGSRAVGELEYGFTRWLTGTVGSAHTMVNDEGRNYTTSGLRTSLGGVLMSLDGAYDLGNNGYSTRLAMFANYFDTDFHLQQKFAQNFISEEGGITSDLLTRLSEVGFDRQDVLPLIGQISTGLSLNRKEYESGRVDNLWVNHLSVSISGISVTNALQYSYDNQTSEAMTGGLSLRGFYDHVLLGGQLDYAVKPNSELTDVKVTGNYPIASDISGNTSLLKFFQGDKHSEFENTVTFDMQKYRVSVTGRADTNSNYFLGAALNLSFGKIPDSSNWMFSSKNMAETGMVVVHPYLDHNYNQQQDEGEEAPPNIAFKVGSQTLKNDENGQLVAIALPTNTPVSVHMDAEKQENPFWTTGVDEYRVVPRSGTAMVLEYPLFETSQIDGTVKVPTGSANALSVELVSTEGQVVAVTRTAFDGYYLLQGVMPGAYTVRVGEENLTQRQLKQAEEYSITIKAADFFTKDITLTPLSTNNETPGQSSL
jgi:hypothetical protein